MGEGVRGGRRESGDIDFTALAKEVGIVRRSIDGEEFGDIKVVGFIEIVESLRGEFEKFPGDRFRVVISKRGGSLGECSVRVGNGSFRDGVLPVVLVRIEENFQGRRAPDGEVGEANRLSTAAPETDQRGKVGGEMSRGIQTLKVRIGGDGVKGDPSVGGAAAGKE